MMKTLSTIILVLIIVALLVFSMLTNTTKKNQTEGDIENLQEIVMTELNNSFDYTSREIVGATKIDKEHFEANIQERISKLKGAKMNDKEPQITVEYIELDNGGESKKSIVAIMVKVVNGANEIYTASYEFDVIK